VPPRQRPTICRMRTTDVSRTHGCGLRAGPTGYRDVEGTTKHAKGRETGTVHPVHSARGLHGRSGRSPSLDLPLSRSFACFVVGNPLQPGSAPICSANMQDLRFCDDVSQARAPEIGRETTDDTDFTDDPDPVSISAIRVIRGQSVSMLGFRPRAPGCGSAALGPSALSAVHAVLRCLSMTADLADGRGSRIARVAPGLQQHFRGPCQVSFCPGHGHRDATIGAPL
jgi:hypothetical protein